MQVEEVFFFFFFYNDLKPKPDGMNEGTIRKRRGLYKVKTWYTNTIIIWNSTKSLWRDIGTVKVSPIIFSWEEFKENQRSKTNAKAVDFEYGWLLDCKFLYYKFYNSSFKVLKKRSIKIHPRWEIIRFETCEFAMPKKIGKTFAR